MLTETPFETIADDEPPFDAAELHESDDEFEERWNFAPDPMGYEAIRAAHPDIFAIETQACRDCGASFPYDPDADRCDDCTAATLNPTPLAA